MGPAPCGPALHLEPPEVQCLQARQDAQRPSDGRRSVRADAVVTAKTEGGLDGVGSSGGMYGGGMGRGVWRGLAGLPPCAARERLQGLGATRAAPRRAAGEASLALPPVHPAPPLHHPTQHPLRRLQTPEARAQALSNQTWGGALPGRPLFSILLYSLSLSE